MPESIDTTVRTRCGACEVMYTVNCPVGLLNEATQPQVSSGQGCTRGFRISSRTVTGAAAKTASVAALSRVNQGGKRDNQDGKFSDGVVFEPFGSDLPL